MIFWLVLKVEINSSRVIIILKDFGFFLEDFWKINIIVWARLISWVSLQLLLIQRFGERFWCFCKISTTPRSLPNSNVSKKRLLESLIHVLQ